MADSTAQATFIAKGQPITVSPEEGLIADKGAAAILQATPKAEAAVTIGQFRSAEEAVEISLNDEEVVELAMEDNLVLYTTVQRLKEDLLPERARGDGETSFRLPERISFSNQRTRGEEGLLVKSIKALDIKGKLLDAAGSKAGGLAARKIAEKIEEQLVGPDVLYHLTTATAEAADKVSLQPALTENIPTTQPLLLFIHGTASSTQGSFSELWTDTDSNDTIWQDLRGHYGDRIYALEHRTLTNSPIDNLIDLLNKLPVGCRLHLVSHSRGGLVGELLCRAQFKNNRDPFTEDDIALFDPQLTSGLAGLLDILRKDYSHHQQQLRKLNALMLEKKPVIERFVRVACPARGTTLASGKLDVYLSGILNVIGLIPALKASPIYDLLKAFVLAVAKERTEPEHLPGLEAQMPGSPFIAMLNSAPESVAAHLAVIKGDIEPTGILKKISIFFLDRFYESDHDLVVNTPSMDGGARREHAIPILFDQGKAINHFRYFTNERTRKGLFAGLTDQALPPAGFRLELQKAVEIARTLPMGKQPDQVPAVFVLPGITGSHLAVDGNRVWIDFFDLVRGRFSELNIKAAHVAAQSPVAKAYGDLIDYLGQQHYVIPFAYDWRKSLLEAGRDLGGMVDERLRNSDQPVRIVAHSMGGLVTRAMMAECPQVWERMQQRDGSRVLLLGTPIRGSYSIPRIFARQERLIRMLALADLHHDQDELLDIIRKFPGVCELLPIDDQGKIAVADALWEEFGRVLGGKWKRPTKAILKQAQATWNKLMEVTLDPERIFYVAGRAPATPIGVQIDDSDAETAKIVFSATDRGDGQVPWATGIPEGIRCWFVNAVHGDIPDHRSAFGAFQEILDTGFTRQLATQPPVSREAEKERLLPPDHVDIFPGDDQLIAAALGKAPHRPAAKGPGLPQLQVSVVHGNLRFATSPLAVGHYAGDTIVSAEAVLDELLDHRLRHRQQRGVYPGQLMTSEVLFNPSAQQFPGVVVVGLGEVGQLTPGKLTNTFRDAVIRYVLIGKETGSFAEDEPITLSSLLIGTGAGGLSVKDTVACLIRGVTDANRLLAGETNNPDYTVARLQFLELQQDAAIEAQYALLGIAASAEFDGTVVAAPLLTAGNGGRCRAYFGEDINWWERLRIESTPDGGLKYTVMGKMARADIRTQAIQRQSIEPFLQQITTHTSANNQAGRVLFELLVPPELKGHAADNQRLMLVVNKEAAAYPWELLEYAGREGNEPLAIKAGMIRQLTTTNVTPATVCTTLNALVIGDPYAGERSLFSDLPGARKEARAVATLLGEKHVEVSDLLIRESGTAILTSLLTGKYGILHLAGHGVVDFDLPGTTVASAAGPVRKGNEPRTGMLIGQDLFLTPTEIRQLPYTPSFVFINCCHLGKIKSGQTRYAGQRYRLAANLATQFIQQGVKAVIAAGWAVDDEAALTFATTFYSRFLQGECFGDAVKQARETTYCLHPSVNTWGAYQCYGDPDFRLTGLTGPRKSAPPTSFVSLAEYIIALQNIAQDAATATAGDISSLTARIGQILENLPEGYAKDARLLAAAGEAWGELGRYRKAIDFYTKALQAEKAFAYIRCAEQLANFQCRLAVELNRSGEKKEAKALIDAAITLLQTLNDSFKKNVERLALLGSAYKRLAQVHAANRDTEAARKGLARMQSFYQDAYMRAASSGAGPYAYPLINALAAGWLLQDDTGPHQLKDPVGLLLEAKQANMVPELNQEHFWEAVTATDCTLMLMLIEGRLTSDTRKDLAAKYEAIARVASSPRQMQSVVEHTEFLAELSTCMHLPQSKELQHLGQQLQKIL